MPKKPPSAVKIATEIVAREPVLTPGQVARMRAEIHSGLTPRLKTAFEVLDGHRQWSPQQVAVFKALLNKLVPDVSASYSRVDIQEKPMHELTREELEMIAAKGMITIDVEPSK